MKKKWLATAVSKKYLLIFLVAFLALVLVFAYGKKSSPPQVECVVNADVVCGAPRNITGMVYSQCEYSGEVAIKTDLGIDWSVASGPWSCVAAGRAGGRLYAVFEKELSLDVIQADYGPFKNVYACYSKRFNITGPIAIPAIAVLRCIYLVVDVNSGRGFLFFSPGRGCFQSFPGGVNSSGKPPFVFAEDGVYVLKSVAFREVAGDPLLNCAYVVDVEIDSSKLKEGKPLQNVTGTYIKLG